MDDLSWLCDEYGVFLTRDAISAGFSPRTFHRMVRRGSAHRLRHGAYTTPARWDASGAGERHLLTARAAFLTAKAPVALSHVSSVITHTAGWWDLPLKEVDLTRLDGRPAGRHDAGVRQHAPTRSWVEVEPFDGLLRTPAAQAVLELATIVDLEHSLVVANSMLHEGRVTREQLEAQAVDMLSTPGTRCHEILLRECDPRLESVGETRTQFAMRGSGLPRPIPQYPVMDSTGRVFAYLDLALPDLGVWVEFDGMVKYERYLRPGERAADAVLRERNRERQIESMTGWICVRVTWADLHDPHRICQRIREAAVLAASRRRAQQSPPA